MHRSKLFVSRFLLSLWIVLFSAFLFLILSEHRGIGTYPMVGIYLNEDVGKAIPLPNRAFTCTEAVQHTQCKADVQGRSLVLNIAPERSGGLYLSSCEAQYDGQPIVCNNQGMELAPAPADSFELSGLGLSAQDMRSLRWRYWRLNMLLGLGENRLFQVSVGLALATGLASGYLICTLLSRLSRSSIDSVAQPAIGAIGAFGAFGITAYLLLWLLLWAGFVD